MNTFPLISVIIPVYNVKKYLQRCLDSVIEQTYQNLEVILIDDGSTDHSGKICKEYAKKDVRIHVISQKNQGVGAARNKGLDTAKGEYITFVDSDDFISKDMIETMYGELIRLNVTYIGCGYNHLDSKGNILGSYTVNEITTYSGIQALQRHYMISEKKENFILVWGKLFRRELFHCLRFSSELFFEDMHLMPYILQKCNKIAFVPYIGYNYQKNGNSITNKQDNAHIACLYKDSFLIWKNHLELYRRNGWSDLVTAVKCACVNKVIAHGISNSIPKEMYQESVVLLRRYTITLLFSHIPLKQKTYYMLFCLIGAKGYRKLRTICHTSDTR